MHCILEVEALNLQKQLPPFLLVKSSVGPLIYLPEDSLTSTIPAVFALIILISVILFFWISAVFVYYPEAYYSIYFLTSQLEYMSHNQINIVLQCNPVWSYNVIIGNNVIFLLHWNLNEFERIANNSNFVIDCNINFISYRHLYRVLQIRWIKRFFAAKFNLNFRNYNLDSINCVLYQHYWPPILGDPWKTIHVEFINPEISDATGFVCLLKNIPNNQ